MEICYNKLWKLLKEKGMLKTELREVASDTEVNDYEESIPR